MRLFVLFISIFTFFAANADTLKPPSFPPEGARVAIFDKFVAELERLDAEGLPARKNRPESWKQTIAKLREQSRTASDAISFGQVFRKLDMTYPNLHAQVSLAEPYDLEFNRQRPQIAVRFGTKTIDRDAKNLLYVISSIDGDKLKDVKEANRPALGDELIAINGRQMSEWSRENFIFCKFPMRAQCEANIFDSFRKEYLSWDRRQTLVYTLRRNGREFKSAIPVEVSKHQTTVGASLRANAEPARYQGFRPTYEGYNVRTFESDQHRGVVVLKLTSFAYRDIEKDEKVQSISDEVDQFYNGFWKAKNSVTKKLIIDLIDNAGGDAPIDWYSIFYGKPFQEAYVQFKKLPELDDPVIRKDLFYGDSGKEIWFSDLIQAGKYETIKSGAFLPSTPMFCVSAHENCDKGLFRVRTDGFKGQVRLLVNEWCISSCTGFVWSMKSYFGSRLKVVGIPDSGDSAYARLFLDVYLDASTPQGFRTSVTGREGGSRQRLPTDALLRQQIAVTRSTDSKGNVISAAPTTVDVWVSYKRPEIGEEWEVRTFKEALKN